MLGLRYVVCASCDAVSAVPAADTVRECGRCRGTELREVTGRMQDASYFLADR